MACGIHADAMWHARPHGRATLAHAGSLGGPNGHGCVAGATQVHTDARGGDTWQVMGLAFEGSTG